MTHFFCLNLSSVVGLSFVDLQVSEWNQTVLTFDGVDVTGERLAMEVSSSYSYGLKNYILIFMVVNLLYVSF